MAHDIAVDLYRCEVDVEYNTAADGFGANTRVCWWKSLSAATGAPATLELLDRTLAAAGYRRMCDWRERVTNSGAVRYFADASSVEFFASRSEVSTESSWRRL